MKTFTIPLCFIKLSQLISALGMLSVSDVNDSTGGAQETFKFGYYHNLCGFFYDLQIPLNVYSVLFWAVFFYQLNIQVFNLAQLKNQSWKS